MINERGIKFLHENTRPLAYTSLVETAGAISDNHDKYDFEQVKHILWLAGFDTLTSQRAEIHSFLDKIV